MFLNVIDFPWSWVRGSSSFLQGMVVMVLSRGVYKAAIGEIVCLCV